MAGCFDDSKQQTLHDYKTFIEPILKKLWHGCEWFSNEAKNDDIVASSLDTYSGIDVWRINPKDKTVKGVASRIQRSDICWATFTVRHERESGSETEYSKRLRAIKNGEIYPNLTYQAYISVDGEKFLGLAIARTADIFSFIEKEKPALKKTGKNQIGQASFFVVKWQTMKDKGYDIVVVKPCENGFVYDCGKGEKFLTL